MASIKKFERYVPSNNDDVSSKGNGNPPGGGELEARVKRLEDDMRQLLQDSAEIKATLKHIATKADIESAKSALSDRISNVEGQAKHMLTFWQFLTVTGVFLALVMRWPELFRLAGISVGLSAH